MIRPNLWERSMFRVQSPPDDTTAPTAPAQAGGSNPLTGATETTLPRLATFKGLVLGSIPYALVACVAAFLIGAVLWAVGAFDHIRSIRRGGRRR
jgi:hypothetical protein